MCVQDDAVFTFNNKQTQQPLLPMPHIGSLLHNYHHLQPQQPTFQDQSLWIIIYVTGGLVFGMLLIILIGVCFKKKGNPQNSITFQARDKPLSPTPSDVVRLNQIQKYQSMLKVQSGPNSLYNMHSQIVGGRNVGSMIGQQQQTTIGQSLIVPTVIAVTPSNYNHQMILPVATVTQLDAFRPTSQLPLPTQMSFKKTTQEVVVPQAPPLNGMINQTPVMPFNQPMAPMPSLPAIRSTTVQALGQPRLVETAVTKPTTTMTKSNMYFERPQLLD